MAPGDILYDNGVRGLHARMQRGGVARFEFRRMRHGIRHFAVIGEYGVFTLHEAREIARDIWRDVLQGITPAQKRQQTMQDRSVRDLLERYIAEFVEPQRAQATVSAYRSAARSVLYPHLGTLRIRDLARQDVRRMIDQEGSARMGMVKTAVRALAAAINWAIREAEILPGGFVNPARNQNLKSSPARKIKLDREHLRQVFQCLEEMDASDDSDPWRSNAIRLLIFTGLRTKEVLRLRWSDVELELGKLLIEESKTGEKNALLTHPVRIVLKEIPRISGSPWVFPSPIDPSKPRSDSSLRALWHRVRDRLGLGHVQLRDLRRTYVSWIARAGGSLQQAQVLIRHASMNTTMRYSWIFEDDEKDIGDRTAEYLANAAGWNTK